MPKKVATLSGTQIRDLKKMLPIKFVWLPSWLFYLELKEVVEF